MRVRCAWCPGKPILREKPPYDDPSITDSICEKCAAEVRRQAGLLRQKSGSPNPRRSRYHRSVARKRTIPGEVLEIRYRRSGRNGGKYYHPFKPGVRMVANADGSVTLRGRQNIHADDREPGFWERYGHGHGRRRNPTMARGFKLDGMTLALLAGGAFLIFKGGLLDSLTGSMFARPAGADPATGAEPILYWFNDQTFEVVERWGTTPPGPGFRPASSYEVSVYGVSVGGGM
jgi:hypothetical protein